jgi:ribosomal protein S17
MLNLNEVLEFIKNSDLQEFNKIKNAVSIRKSELAYDAKLSFRVGDMVGIDHKKISPNETFRVTKINSKNIKVQGDNGSYTVAPSLLVKKTFTTEVYS